MFTSICLNLQQCSAEIFSWLSKQPAVKEESLTDWYLFQLSERIDCLTYLQFTRHEEGNKTGADWEWWFVFSDTEAFAARIQAKKLKHKDDNYPGIAYTSVGKLQIDRLIEDASADDFAPFYVFYSDAKSDPLCRAHESLHTESVYLGDAYRLRDEFIHKGKRRLSPEQVLAHTNPLSCLFCCSLFLPLASYDTFREHYDTYFPSGTQTGNEDNRRNGQGFRRPASYVLSLLESKQGADWVEQRLLRELPNANAIIVMDLRDRPGQ